MSDTITETTTVDGASLRRLVRVDEGRWLAGVCVGLGRYFDVNPLVYRIAFAALSLAGGTGLLLYLAAWLVMPSESSDDSIAVEALREHRDRPWLLIGVGLLAFGAILALSEVSFWPGTGNVWLAAVLVGAAIVWWHVGRRPDGSRAEQAAGPPAPAAGVPLVAARRAVRAGDSARSRSCGERRSRRGVRPAGHCPGPAPAVAGGAGGGAAA